MPVYIVSTMVFLINIPFGYWRRGSKKFSLNWFSAIHLPVIISILLRLLFHIKFKWYYLLVFILVFIVGQAIGQLIYKLYKKQN